jgi:dTMP kinase
MANNKGKLIVIEGMDGSGKETQSKLLHKNLTEKGIKAIHVSFPNYESDSAALLKRYLTGRYNPHSKEISQHLGYIRRIAAFYAVDRAATFMDKVYEVNTKSIFELMDEGVHVICDRYTTSTMIHQSANIEYENDYIKGIVVDQFVKWVAEFEYGELALPKPDLVAYLDVDPEISIRNLKKRYGIDGKPEAGDIDILENIEHLKRVHAISRKVVKLQDWQTVQCSRERDGELEQAPIETIQNILLAMVKGYVGI